MTILGIVPARGGSKRIKHKNLVPVRGKPLISYTVAVALEARRQGYLSRVVVSTDCPRIRETCLRMGIEAPFLRPKAIAGDEAKSIDVVLHALRYYESRQIRFDAVMLLQPTSPLRRVRDIVSAVSLFGRRRCSSLISCYRHSALPTSYLYAKRGEYAIGLDRTHNRGVPRQQDIDTYVRNGAIYLTTTAYLKAHKRIVCRKPLLCEMPVSVSININDPGDLVALNKIMRDGGRGAVC